MNGKTLVLLACVFASFLFVANVSFVAATINTPVKYYYCTFTPTISLPLAKYGTQAFNLSCFQYLNGVSTTVDCRELNPIFDTSGIGTVTPLPLLPGVPSALTFTVTKDFYGFRYLTFIGRNSTDPGWEFNCRAIIRSSGRGLPSPTQMGAPQLFSLQGVLKSKSSGAPISAPTALEVKICEPNTGGGTIAGSIVPGSCCGTLLHDETFSAANDASGRFNVLVGGTDPLQLLANKKYVMQLYVGASKEVIKFGDSECTVFESPFGPGPYDSLQGPITISKFNDPLIQDYRSPALTVGSTYGTALSVEGASECSSALNVEGISKLNGDTIAKNVYATNLYATNDANVGGVSLVNYSTGWFTQNNGVARKNSFAQVFAGNVTVLSTGPATISLPFEKPTGCSSSAPEYYVNIRDTAPAAGVAYAPVITRNSNSFSIANAGTTKYYEFVVVGGYNCPPSLVQEPIQCAD